MDKKCEFCMALRPIVYCKADAAHLCLSCDAKVHSANALSFRHPRTLVCESCRHQPAIVRCYDHQMFMCQSCDTSHHVSFHHQKRAVSCFVGCPSAKELAALWGFELDELEGSNCTRKDQCVESSVSEGSCSRSEVNSVSVLYAEVDGGSTGRITKAVKDNHKQQNSYLILQQIVELERLQLSDGIDSSCSLHVKDQTVGLRHDTPLKFQKTQSHPIENSVEFQETDSPLEDKNENPLSSSPFSQMDSENPLHGDSFWQCKSPAHNNEIWLQNMQDIGVCNEVLCFDDVKIPDVDLTFCNFEELFRTEHEPIRATMVDYENVSCSFADKLDRGCVSTLEQSRITGDSSCSEYKDDEISPTFPEQILHYDHYDNTKLESKENVIMRYKEKKII